MKKVDDIHMILSFNFTHGMVLLEQTQLRAVLHTR